MVNFSGEIREMGVGGEGFPVHCIQMRREHVLVVYVSAVYLQQKGQRPGGKLRINRSIVSVPREEVDVNRV